MRDKKKIAEIIRALRLKTVEGGCSEEEAASAAEKVSKLLSDYNMTLDECDIRESEFSHSTYSQDDHVGERLWKIAQGISHLLDVKYWASRAGEIPSVNFFGFDHEIQIADYLLEVCRGAMDRRYADLQKEFRLLRSNVQRRKIISYLDGMSDRLRKRLIEMKPVQPPGKGLIILKDQLIDAELDRLGKKFDEGRGRQSSNFDPLYEQGKIDAEKVSLNKGVSKSGTDAIKVGHG